ncbi:MAG: hypothetical protein JWO05_1771 [Gemmatimonadetes bacterium]|nr:hypothetical protein [Gemmatimonadota bacterium]
MFAAMLRAQWRWARLPIALLTVLAFAIPLLSVRLLEASDPRYVMATMQQWAVAYAALAGLVGLFLALAAWSSDHRGRHVYALALPLPRWRFVLNRYAAGAMMTVVPTLALLVSAFLATRNGVVPVGLHTYIGALALRFMLASLVGFSVFFLVASSSARMAAYVLSAMVAIVVADILLNSAGLDYSLTSHIMDVVFAKPGLLAAFTGRWMLLDV